MLTRWWHLVAAIAILTTGCVTIEYDASSEDGESEEGTERQAATVESHPPDDQGSPDDVDGSGEDAPSDQGSQDDVDGSGEDAPRDQVAPANASEPTEDQHEWAERTGYKFRGLAIGGTEINWARITMISAGDSGPIDAKHFYFWVGAGDSRSPTEACSTARLQGDACHDPFEPGDTWYVGDVVYLPCLETGETEFGVYLWGVVGRWSLTCEAPAI